MKKHTRSISTNNMMNSFSMPAIIALTAILVVGCASMPAPTDQMAVAKAAVTTAARDGGNEFAPLELKSAMEKMERAERAMTDKDYTLAKTLAEQALLDAKLAETKTSASKTQKSVKEVEESNRVLREELQRTTK